MFSFIEEKFYVIMGELVSKGIMKSLMRMIQQFFCHCFHWMNAKGKLPNDSLTPSILKQITSFIFQCKDIISEVITCFGPIPFEVWMCHRLFCSFHKKMAAVHKIKYHIHYLCELWCGLTFHKTRMSNFIMKEVKIICTWSTSYLCCNFHINFVFLF